MSQDNSPMEFTPIFVQDYVENYANYCDNPHENTLTYKENEELRKEFFYSKPLELNNSQDPEIPNGYFLKTKTPTGLYKKKIKKDGEYDLQFVGDLIYVIGLTRDYQSSNWGMLIYWKDLDGIKHTKVLSQKDLNSQSSEWFSELSSEGWRGDKRLLQEFLLASRPSKRFESAIKVGWHEKDYILPDTRFSVSGNKGLFFNTKTSRLYTQKGSLEAWKQLTYIAVGNTRLEFALMASFASAMLDIAKLESGGFSFEGGSSCGKTTALRLASSVWGPEEHIRTWRATDNALEGIAVLHNDNTLILDEMGQANAKVVSEAVYMLSNGKGKNRSKKDGNIRPSHEWRVLILSSGEVGLSEKLAEGNIKVKAGQEVRLVGIPTRKEDIAQLHDFDSSGVLINTINSLAKENYGYAGRMFIEHITQNREQIEDKIALEIQTYVNFLCLGIRNEQIKRVAQRFALVALAGRIAKDLGLLPYVLDIDASVSSCFMDWLETRGNTGSSEDAQILSTIKLCIETHGASRFQNLDTPEEKVINRLGYKKGNYYYFLPETFQGEVLKGYNFKRACETLRKEGWLMYEKDQESIRYKKRISIDNVRIYCYWITLTDTDTTTE